LSTTASLHAFFQINYDIQQATDYYAASVLEWERVGRKWAEETDEGGSLGDFDLPVTAMEAIGNIGYEFFFLFGHSREDAIETDKFEYEMTYATNEPALYIRARKNSSGTIAGCAFDLGSFFEKIKDSNNIVRFDIFHKTGIDDDENEKF
jgi:hypothetical protein